MSAFWERIRKNQWKWIIYVLALILIGLIAWAAYQRFIEGRAWAEWTGFGEYTGDIPAEDRGKTLWDWMELLIIPAILGFGAILFNKAQKDNEQRLALDQQRENTLQSYLDNMAELLLKENLLEKKDVDDEPTVDVAQVRTVTTLRILDTKRKNIVLQFLRDANLADFLLVGASLPEVDLSNTNLYAYVLSNANLGNSNLSGASLSKADLSGANLHAANLTAADLSEADLSKAFLIETDLSDARLLKANLVRAHGSGAKLIRTDLSGADLSKADLRRADLSGADLGGGPRDRADIFRSFLYRGSPRANLSDADLSDANLSEAKVVDEQLREARTLFGAMMPNGKMYDGRFDRKENQIPEE